MHSAVSTVLKVNTTAQMKEMLPNIHHLNRNRECVDLTENALLRINTQIYTAAGKSWSFMFHYFIILYYLIINTR